MEKLPKEFINELIGLKEAVDPGIQEELKIEYCPFCGEPLFELDNDEWACMCPQFQDFIGLKAPGWLLDHFDYDILLENFLGE